MGLTLGQCRRCGKLFQSWGQAICPQCMEDREHCYILVRDYVYQHPHANLFEIAKDTGVDEPLILEFLKEERLTLGEDERALKCEKCGKPIAKGRYCDKCKAYLGNAFFKDSAGSAKQLDQAAKRKRTDVGISSGRKDRMHLEFDKK